VLESKGTSPIQQKICLSGFGIRSRGGVRRRKCGASCHFAERTQTFPAEGKDSANFAERTEPSHADLKKRTQNEASHGYDGREPEHPTAGLSVNT
jgi:hypothetical protein